MDGGLDAAHPRLRTSAATALRRGSSALALCGLLANARALAEQAPPAQQSASAASSDDTAGWGADDSVGFAAPASTSASGATESAAPAADDAPWPLVLSGFERLVLGMWVERTRSNPFASARLALQLDLDYTQSFRMGGSSGAIRLHAVGQLWYDFAYQYQRESYDEPLLDVYEWGSLPREIEAVLTLGPLQVAVGRQILNWGQGEVLDLLDRINPRDVREPGLTALDEMRVPVLMTRADLALGKSHLQFVVVHETSYGLLAPPLAPYSPLRALLLETPVLGAMLGDRELRYAHSPAPALLNVDAQQYHGRWMYSGSAMELALHAGSVLEPLGIPLLPAPAAFASSELFIQLVHPRYTLLGCSLAVPFSSLLLRFEGGFSVARPTALRRTATALLDVASARYHQLDALVGITYVFNGATTAGLEIAQSYLVHNPARDAGAAWETLWPVEATRLALRFDQSLFRERLRIGVVALVIGLIELNGVMVRGELGYALTDALRVQLQYISYHPTQQFGVFYGFTSHDRLVLTAQWNFST
jgi:hypothetical protein